MQNMHASLNTDIDIYILAPNDTPQMGGHSKTGITKTWAGMISHKKPLLSGYELFHTCSTSVYVFIYH